MNWIPITERLPDTDGSYLIHAESADPEKPYMQVAWYSPDDGWSLLPAIFIPSITHWMQLELPHKYLPSLRIDGPPYFEDDEECGYCHRPIGQPHKPGCRQ